MAHFIKNFLREIQIQITQLVLPLQKNVGQLHNFQNFLCRRSYKLKNLKNFDNVSY